MLFSQFLFYFKQQMRQLALFSGLVDKKTKLMKIGMAVFAKNSINFKKSEIAMKIEPDFDLGEIKKQLRHEQLLKRRSR